MFQSTHPHGVRRPSCGTPWRRVIVSIHAPARGATFMISIITGIHSLFQSTHPHGVRLEIKQVGSEDDSFNPRTRTGCDTVFLLQFYCWMGFNPRTRTGCDLAYCPCPRCHRCFNPRTRTGCDIVGRIQVGSVSGFNPRTRTGCDIICVGSRCRFFSFNPRTRTGCDRLVHLVNKISQVFQSTHPHGVRLIK